MFLYFVVCMFVYYLHAIARIKKYLLVFLSLILRVQYGLALLSSYSAKVLSLLKVDVIFFTKLVFLTIVSTLFLLYKLPLFETYLQAGAAYLNFEQQGTGLGTFLREQEKVIPFVGLFTVPIKILQNISDPFPNFNLYYHGGYNLYAIKDFLSFFFVGYITIFVFLLYFFSFFRRMTHSFFLYRY